MNKGTTTAEYIMEDPREALRLELKVDPDAWVQKYLAHRVSPGGRGPFGWMRSGRHFARGDPFGFFN